MILAFVAALALLGGGYVYFADKTEEQQIQTLPWTQGSVPGVIRTVTPSGIASGDSILLMNVHWTELYKGSKKSKACFKEAGCQKIKFLSIKAGSFSFRPKEKNLPPMIKVAIIK